MNGLTVERYFNWRREGLRDCEILEKLHYSRNSTMMLTRWKKKNGIVLTNRKALLPKKEQILCDNEKEVLQLRRNGAKIAEIIARYGVSVDVYKVWLKRMKEENKCK